MLEADQFVLSHVRNAPNEAKRLLGDQKLRIDRLAASGENSGTVQETLGLLEGYLSILERQSEYLSRKSRRARPGDASGPMRHAGPSRGLAQLTAPSGLPSGGFVMANFLAKPSPSEALRQSLRIRRCPHPVQSASGQACYRELCEAQRALGLNCMDGLRSVIPDREEQITTSRC